MQFGLTETQELLKSSAREFFPVECPMAEVRRLMETDTAYDERLYGKMAEQGWTGLMFSEPYDGMGLGLVEMAAAFEEMGRALVPGPFLSTVALAATAIDSAASEEQKRKYLAPICRGEARATLMTDRRFVTDAGVADFLVCAVGGELRIVDRAAVRVQAMPAIDGTRKLYAVDLDGARGEVLATGERARAAVERALEVATVALVAEMVGGMQRVLEMTVEYAKTRKQFGRPIGQFQAVQHMCADMLALTESSRSAAYYAAWALEQGAPDARLAVSVAKVYASDAYREVGNRGIQVHGGMGFTWENDLHLYYRRAKASEILFGDAIHHRERIAQEVLDQPERRETISSTAVSARD